VGYLAGALRNPDRTLSFRQVSTVRLAEERFGSAERHARHARARAEALRRIGASLADATHQLRQSAEHRERRMKINERIEELWSDVRYAARGLARRPVFTAVAVVTLAIGIGATTAIFSALNVLLIRPLPYARPNELMKVSLTAPPRQDTPARPDMVWSYPKFTVFRQDQRVFSDLALYNLNEATLTSGEPRWMTVEYVGASYLRVLGLRPLRGRDFDRSIDAHPGAPHQAIISYALWQNRFDADPSSSAAWWTSTASRGRSSA
jgi:putative ABC transport system permease protein